MLVAEGAAALLTDIGGSTVAASPGAMASSAVVDVRDESAREAVMQGLLAQNGRLDIVVDNAGIAGFKAAAVHDPEHASLAHR